MPADPKIAAIVGSGFIGRAWAIAFARAGCSVRLYDAQSTAGPAALAFIDSVLDDLAANDLLLGSTAAEVQTRISTATDLGQALAGADHVQENTPEDLETKRRIFPELDRLAAKDAIIASSTSALVPSSFMENVPGRARCVVVHPINPPYLIPAVEIVPSQWTSAETLERTRSFMTAIGQSPMVMNREIDGFIMNWIQGALLEEAFRLVADGVCTVEDVDIGIRGGLALRWSFMGPFETIDLNARRRRARLCRALPGNLCPAVSVHATSRRLVRICTQGRRGGPPGASPRRQTGRAATLARPAPHGTAPLQAPGAHRNRRIARELKVGK